MITVISKAPAIKYKTTCTDSTCRAILHFDHDDIKFHKTYSMGREFDAFEGIVCPLCRQVLKKKDFEVVI